MPFSTGALLKETTWTYLSYMWGAFQAFHMNITASGLWWRVLLTPPHTHLSHSGIHHTHSSPLTPSSPITKWFVDVWLLVFWILSSSTEMRYLRNHILKSKQSLYHLLHVASRTGSQFLVIAELVNRNLTVLGEFSRPHLISQFQRGNMRNKLSLHKYCCKIKRKIINVVASASPVPFQMPRILNFSSQCNHLVLVYFIRIK